MIGNETRMVHGPFSGVKDNSFVIRFLGGINSKVWLTLPSGQGHRPLDREKLYLFLLLERFRQRFQPVIHLLLASRQVNQVKEKNRPDDSIAEKKVRHTPSTILTERFTFRVTSSAMLEFRRMAIRNTTKVTQRTVIAMTENIKACIISGSNSAPLLVMTTG